MYKTIKIIVVFTKFKFKYFFSVSAISLYNFVKDIVNTYYILVYVVVYVCTQVIVCVHA